MLPSLNAWLAQVLAALGETFKQGIVLRTSPIGGMAEDCNIIGNKSALCVMLFRMHLFTWVSDGIVLAYGFRLLCRLSAGVA